MGKYLDIEKLARKYNSTPEMIASIGIDILRAIDETMTKKGKPMALVAVGAELGLEGAWHYSEIVGHCYSSQDELCGDELMMWGETCSRYSSDLLRFKPLREVWEFDKENDEEED